MKSVGYARVSSEEQVRDGVSMDAQEAKIRAYASLNGLDLSEVIVDPGKSGKSLQREGLQRLIQLCLEKAVGHVVVYSLSRLSRKTKDLLFLLEDIFQKNEVQFHSVIEKIDSSSAQGRFFISVIASLSQLERDQISERTRDAMQFKKSKGERLGAPVLGIHIENGEAVEDPKEAETLNYAWTLRNEGLTLKEIARRLTAAGFKPKKGSIWQTSSLHRIFNRPLPPTTEPSIGVKRRLEAKIGR